MAINIPTIPAPQVRFVSLPADAHEALALSKRIRDNILDAQDGGLRGGWLGNAESLAHSLNYYIHLLIHEYRDREKNLLCVAFSAGRLSGIAQENSRRGPQRHRELAGRVWTNANELHRALQAVDWSGPLVVWKGACGCHFEKLSDEDPGAHVIECDEARALNGRHHDVWGEALAAELTHQGNPGLIADKHCRAAAAYRVFKAHFGGH